MAQGNFFQNILSSILGSGDANAVKRKMLKRIVKNLSKTKYHFYKAGSHEADPSLAKFFYEIYKAISPAQLMFANSNPAALKRVVIDLSLSDKQRAALEELSEESIIAEARTMPLSQLTEKVNDTLEIFNAEFNSEKIAAADGLYTKFMMFKNFCQYDFYFLLKKFDSSLRERNFDSVPKFSPINGTYITEDIKNFTAIAWILPFDDDWEDVFRLLKAIKGVEPISSGIWRKILVRLKNVRDHHIFEMLIQLITENPVYKENFKAEEHHVMDEFISQTRTTTEDVLGRLRAEQTAGKVDSLLSQIFGSSSVDPLKNYNETSGSAYERRNLDGFLYCNPLSYLRQFMLDYVKKEVRELSDILLVRGEWATQTMSQPMSEAYHQLMEITNAIIALDDKFSESGEYGNKLRTILPRVDRDKEARNICMMLLNDANNEAAQILISARTNMVNYDRNLKMLLEDFVKAPHSNVIINWKDLDHFAEGKLKQMCIDVYKKIFAFVALLQNFQITISDPS